ncbi:MAG: trehalose-phosphatase [Gemmatimonadales bacterium]
MRSENSKLHFDGGIFDLDGVITHTASLHARAWKRMFDPFLQKAAADNTQPYVPFDSEDDYHIYVDGKPRYQGVKSFLESRRIELPFGKPRDDPQEETICGLGNRKNLIYNELIQNEGVGVFQSTVDLILALREQGTRVGLMSSSKNAAQILRRTGLDGLFEACVDGTVAEQTGLRGKPHPDSYLRTAELLGVSPPRSFVVEDAVSGVEAGVNGEFGLVIGVDRVSRPEELRAAGADVVVEDLEEITVKDIDDMFAQKHANRPSALERWIELKEQWKGKRIVVFLDYDGTLTPIVATPDLAKISEEMRDVLSEVASACTTVIVSGRGREDVAHLVGLDNLYYAGSHGFDIAGPSGTELRHEIGSEYRSTLESVVQRLKAELAETDGALIEDKQFSVAIHYRLVNEAEVAGVERAVDEALAQHPELRKSLGKKIFELRPDVEWDKGKAVLWLLDALDLNDENVVPLYIGDDVTDEDAFVALQDRGLGILVSETPRETKADLSLRDTTEVGTFLRLVSSWQDSSDRAKETAP